MDSDWKRLKQAETIRIVRTCGKEYELWANASMLLFFR